MKANRFRIDWTAVGLFLLLVVMLTFVWLGIVTWIEGAP